MVPRNRIFPALGTPTRIPESFLSGERLPRILDTISPGPCFLRGGQVCLASRNLGERTGGARPDHAQIVPLCSASAVRNTGIDFQRHACYQAVNCNGFLSVSEFSRFPTGRVPRRGGVLVSGSRGKSILKRPADRWPAIGVSSRHSLSFEHDAKFSGKLRSSWAAGCFAAQGISGVSLGEV